MARIALPSIYLTPRDESIIELVFDLGGCGIEHVHLRLWPSGSTCRACYRRVQALVTARYLHEQRLPSLTGTGSGKALLTLGPRGRALLAERADPAQLALLRARRSINPWWANHHFHICTFRVLLELAATGLDDVKLTNWLSEAALKRRPIRVTDKSQANGAQATRTITLVPDGGFTLIYQGREQHAYLELDLGTVSPKRMALRLRGYLLHAATSHSPTPVFIVVPDQARQTLFAQLAAHEASALKMNPTLFWITTWQQLSTDTILTAPIWLQTGLNRLHSIIPKPTATRVASPRRLSQPLAAGTAWKASR